MKTFNRTSMESKRRWDRHSGQSPVFLLIEPVWNRNNDGGTRITHYEYPFNRTSMESKHVVAGFFFNLDHLLLIEPVWNRNIASIGASSGFAPFNRTSMESKRVLLLDRFASEFFFYSRFRNYLYTRMVARTVKLHPILPQANSLCYKINTTSVNLFLDFTIIEPVWNRNQYTWQEISNDFDTF